MYSKRLSIVSVIIILAAIFLTCSKSPNEPTPPEAIIPPTTKLIDESLQKSILAISPGDSIFEFSSSATKIAQLQMNDVIVSGPCEQAPFGFLRKIDRVIVTQEKITVLTSQATLEEAIESGSIKVEKTLSLNDLAGGMILHKGVSLKKSSAGDEFYFELDHEFEGVDVNTKGTMQITPSFQLSLEIKDFKLTEFRFVNTIVQTTSLTLDAQLEFYSLEKEWEIARLPFNPIVAFVGFVPIVIRPLLTIDVGIDGSSTIGLAAKVERTTTETAGVELIDGNFEPINESSKTLKFDPIRPAVGCTFKAYAGPQMNLLLYGLAGPYADLNGYLELEADAFATPWWEFYAGLEFGVGVQVRFLSKEIMDVKIPKVFGFRQLLAQAEEELHGTLEGTVKDAVNGVGLAGVLVQVKKDELLIAETSTTTAGDFSVNVKAGVEYRIQFSKSGYIPVDYDNVKVGLNQTTYLETILQIDETFSGNGDLGGQIVDALNGVGVPNLMLYLREGINNQSGSYLKTSSTDSRGYYAFTNVPAGNYTVQASGDNYNTIFFSVISIGGQSTAFQNATITPLLAANEIRIILNWGSTPDDLDSHLTGPSDNSERFHIFYPFADTNEGSPWPTFVRLDLDDIDEYGPETTTIYHQIGGRYRFSVHDYSNRNSSYSYALSNSSAQVRVYRGSELVEAFFVPSNSGGTLWTVFEMYDNTILPINTMSYESSPQSIQKANTAQTDAHLMIDLPPKD